MTTVPAIDDLWALELAKAHQAAGEDTPSSDAGYWPAAALGLAAWARTVLTTPAGDPLPVSAPTLAALHGEVSNRTRHVLTALADEAQAQPEATPILLLGRLQQPLPALRQALADLGLPHARLIRPFSPGAALLSVPAVLGRMVQGAKALRAATWRPAPRDLAAICFRMALGETSARWVRAHIARQARTIVFGHTGVADSHQLERALQGQGARTLHWVHGVSLGLNFIAGSNVGLFQCGADARWHQALGGYGATLGLPAESPVQGAVGEGWLVLSNLIHPMNADYRRHGLAGEKALLTAVAEAAALAGETRLVWKPHPILFTLDPAIRAEIEAFAAGLNIAPWPHAAGDLGPAADFAMIVTTPSTVAIDMLRLGRLAAIYPSQVPTPGSAVAQFPLQISPVATPQSIAEAAARLADPVQREALFAQAWKAVGPSRVAAWGEVLEAAGEAFRGHET